MIAEKVINAHNKRSNQGEIIVTLFEFCDLSCLFCNQDHDSFIGIDTIKEKINPIIDTINVLKKKGKIEFDIHLMGGELFSDKISDKTFLDYEFLIKEIRQYGKSTNTPIKISFVTNLIWTKTDRIKKFILDNNITLLSSYDPSGRFNSQNFEIFKSNVIKFKENILSFNVILTKPNLDKFIKNQIPFFDYLYDNFTIYFDQYGPGINKDFLLPMDTDLRDFSKFIIDHWPNCHPYKNYFNKTKGEMTCMDTFTVMPTGDFGGCGKFEGISKVIPIKLVMEQKWFDDYNCLECEHFNRCSLGCFMSNHVKSMRTQETCWLKEVYDYIDEKIENRNENTTTN
jgi:MoaA/NifB/PqqE/SkfB family radical SAM enzyme